MRARSPYATALAGFAIGALLASLGIVMAPSRPQDSAAPSVSPVTTIPQPWFLDPSEVQMGPAVMLVDDLAVDGNEAVLRFETFDIAPTALGRYRTNEEIGNRFFSTPEDPVVAPELWTLETTQGDIPGRTGGARVQTARFPVDDTFDLAQVTGLRIDQWRMRVPYVFRFVLDTTSTRPLRLDEGFTIVIGGVIPQSGSVIVQLDIESPSDLFTAGEAAPIRVAGVGPEWISSGSRGGGAQLVLRGDEIPETIELEARTAYYVAFDRPIAIDIEGVIR